ncbi:MAG: substrate-binding domain-containing protein [Pseudonocardiaceae bacterium]
MGLRTSPTALVAAIGLLAAITGCAGSSGDSDRSGIKVGVIVSDPAGSSRWEEVDEPLLHDAMGAEELDAEVENSEGDAAKFAAIADRMIDDGVKVLVIASPNDEAGSAVARKAAARAIPTIHYGYDRHDFGGSSDYYVSFDPVKAGELQGRGLAWGLRGARVRGSTVIEIDGPRTDRITPLLAQAARNVLQPRYNSGAYRLVADRSVDGNEDAGVVFEQLLTANGGHVDGVLAADDGVAGAVIAVLRKKGLNGRVRVTGMGATPEALKAILRGDQFMTVFIPIDQQATAAAKLAGALARNDRAAADTMAPMIVTDTVGHRKVRAVLVSPVFITVDTIDRVIDSGLVSSRDICDGELALRCDQLNIRR